MDHAGQINLCYLRANYFSPIERTVSLFRGRGKKDESEASAECWMMIRGDWLAKSGREKLNVDSRKFFFNVHSRFLVYCKSSFEEDGFI